MSATPIPTKPSSPALSVRSVASADSNNNNHASPDQVSSHDQFDKNGPTVTETPLCTLELVSFEPGDPENPHNWGRGRKTYLILTGVLLCMNSTMGSALTSNLIPYLQQTWAVPSGPQTVLPSSVFLAGFVCGPLVFAPLSEHIGRRPVLLLSFVMFVLATLASAAAPAWPAFLVFRFLAGTFGSPPMSVVGGALADTFVDGLTRGRCIMAWSTATLSGPLVAPIVAGYAAPALGWRWAFWIATIWGGLSLVVIVFWPETLASKILRTKAARLNKEQGVDHFRAVDDLKRLSYWECTKITISRPAKLATEPLIYLSALYMAFVYAVFYMLLVIFATIFKDVYGLSAGITGVIFTIMGVGSILGCMTQLFYDSMAPRLMARHPERKPEYFRLPTACVGGPVFVISLLWLGWASRKDVPWPVPLVSIVPYGFAYQLIFAAMINYVSDAYSGYTASALALLSTTRSVAGALLPLAVNTMLSALGIQWSCTLLAIICAFLGAVPFAFIAWGPRIRAASRFGGSSSEDRELELTRSISAV